MLKALNLKSQYIIIYNCKSYNRNVKGLTAAFSDVHNGLIYFFFFFKHWNIRHSKSKLLIHDCVILCLYYVMCIHSQREM